MIETLQRTSVHVAPWLENLCRLISLGDLMKQFDGVQLLRLLPLFSALDVHARFGKGGSEEIWEAESVAAIHQELRQAEALFQALGLLVASQRARRISEMFPVTPIKLASIGPELGELERIVREELATNLFMYIEPAKAEFYTNLQPCGETVAINFPSASFDLGEAAKCLALNRGTACVFHLMRVMEVGLSVVAASLNDPSISPNPNWQEIINRFQTELKKPLNQRSAVWQADEPFFSGVAVRLTAVKDAWRNPTMHVRGIYTEEQALEIWHHVQSFMRHLSTMLAEVS